MSSTPSQRPSPDPTARGVSRRALLKSAGALGLSGALLGGEARLAGADTTTAGLPFAGAHQPGIATPQQASLCLGSFDLHAASAGELRTLMRRWSAAAERLMAGLPAVAESGDPSRAPGDNNEAAGLAPANLTITFGFGPGVFSLPGVSGAPPGLRPLPRIGDQQLNAKRSGGDLAIQACADDSMVAFHAVRTLYRMAGSAAHLRWIQHGFLGASGSQTPRNLMGFKDGTLNPRTSQPGFDGVVWLGAGDDPAWMRDGTYMVFRRILMNLPHWDNSPLAEQERTIGRAKDSGAPLGGTSEFDAPNFSARTPGGQPAIPLNAHIRLAHPAVNNGIQILRRGYSYDEGVQEIGPVSDARPRSRQPDFSAGLAFIGFMRDPHAQFVPLAQRLARTDALNEYIDHVGSAVFAVPPGASPGGYVGETLLG